MNERRRKTLRRVIDILNDANEIVNSVCEEEQDSLDNMPENLQDSEKCEAMSDAIDNLDDASDSISSAIESISSAI